jgi:hypothetical protein
MSTRTPFTLRCLFAAFAATLSAMALGCSAQADRTYEGNALAHIQLTAAGAPTTFLGGTLRPEDIQVGIVWQVNDDKGSPYGYEALYRSVILAGATTRGPFPERFRLPLFEPPADNVLFGADVYSWIGKFPSATPGRIAYGLIFAARSGPSFASYEDFKNFAYQRLLGGSKTHIVVYIDQDADSQSPWAKIFGGALRMGYNLLRAREFTEEEKTLPRCRDLPAEGWGDPSVTACREFFLHVSPTPNGFSETVDLTFTPDSRNHDFPNLY